MAATTTTSTTSTTTTVYPCSCITFTNPDPVNSAYVGWTNCPGVFASSTAIIEPLGHFKVCGSNPRFLDGNPSNPPIITVGAPCDTTNAYPTCTVPKCHSLVTSGTTGTCTITYYDMYGIYQTLTALPGDTNQICAQVGTVVVSCTGDSSTLVTESNIVCTYFDECATTTTTTTLAPTTSTTTTVRSEEHTSELQSH